MFYANRFNGPHIIPQMERILCCKSLVEDCLCNIVSLAFTLWKKELTYIKLSYMYMVTSPTLDSLKKTKSSYELIVFCPLE